MTGGGAVTGGKFGMEVWPGGMLGLRCDGGDVGMEV